MLRSTTERMPALILISKLKIKTRYEVAIVIKGFGHFNIQKFHSS
jgi:hypothetical protein